MNYKELEKGILALVKKDKKVYTPTEGVNIITPNVITKVRIKDIDIEISSGKSIDEINWLVGFTASKGENRCVKVIDNLKGVKEVIDGYRYW